MARSIFEEEAPYQRTEKAIKISTYEAYEESRRDEKSKSPMMRTWRTKRNSESESRCIPYQINLNKYFFQSRSWRMADKSERRRLKEAKSFYHVTSKARRDNCRKIELSWAKKFPTITDIKKRINELWPKKLKQTSWRRSVKFQRKHPQQKFSSNHKTPFTRLCN